MGGKASSSSSTAGSSSDPTSGSSSTASKDKDSAVAAYLIFSSENSGTLVLHWSATAVPGAILTATPVKPVPKHKLTQNSGRIEMGRNFGVSKTKMLDGFAAFIKVHYSSLRQPFSQIRNLTKHIPFKTKEVVAFDSTIKVHQCDKCEMWTLTGTTVRGISKGASFPTKGVDCIACMPSDNTSFKGVKTMQNATFVGIATREGAFWKR